MRFNLYILILLLLSASLSISALAISRSTQSESAGSINTDKATPSCANTQFYTFAWPTKSQCTKQPRGGTTKGSATTTDKEINPAWLALQAPNLTNFEKDRLAILAMAGPHRVSFDFLETVAYQAGYELSQPYQSWGTEYIFVAEDTGEYISLQHVMVMYFENEDKGISEPMVMKHWRQDWQFEKTQLFVFDGFNQWKQQMLSKDQVKGQWSQAVYQVDDSPRYEGIGAWTHNSSFSSWESQTTWRPLPRRERTVRDDYDVLEGSNKHTILPSGWVHEEDNAKRKLDENDRGSNEAIYVSKELGLARYERIVGHDFEPGKQYWQKSKPFWKDVRTVWQDLVSENQVITINKKSKDGYMFMPFFMKAQAVAESDTYDSEGMEDTIKQMLAPFIIVEPVKKQP